MSKRFFRQSFFTTLCGHVVFAILLVGAIHCKAQDFTSTMKAMQDSVKGAKRFHIVMDVSAFENSQSSKPLFHDKFDVSQAGKNYLYQYSTNELLMNKDLVIMVDKKEHEIRYSKRNNKSEKDFGRQMSFNIDSIFSVYETPQYVGIEGESDHFSIVPKKGSISKIDLYINKSTLLFSQLQYVYKTGALVKIRFDVFDLRPTFRSDTFDEKNYIVKDKKNYLAAAGFRQYQVINLEVEQ